MPDTLAARLLDAQVAWVIGRLTGADLPARIEEVVDDLLDLGRHLTISEAVPAETVKEVVHALLQELPASAATSTLVSVTADATYDGPAETFTLAEVIEREHVEQALAEAFAHPEALEAFLDRIAESPLVSGVTTRFVGRLVSEVVATNRAVAEKIPGMGSLVSLGAGMAGKVVGAADKQFEGLLGDTAGKGTTFAMRRLNKVLLDSLRDPQAQEAVLQVFDMYADTPLGGAERLGDRDGAHRVAGLAQEISINALASAPARALADTIVDGFLAAYGEESVTTLVEDLGADRDALVARAQAVAPPLIAAAIASGEVEAVARRQLAPFWESAEVAALLEG